MIRYSIEVLWHFSCEACGKWWSIGDHQAHDKQELNCPHCGMKGDLSPAEPLETIEMKQDKYREVAEAMEKTGVWIAHGPLKDDGWISWEGGECPIPKHTWVQIKTLGGACGKAHAGFYRWNHADHPEDIIAYRVIGD